MHIDLQSTIVPCTPEQHTIKHYDASINKVVIQKFVVLYNELYRVQSTVDDVQFLSEHGICRCCRMKNLTQKAG